MDFPVYEVTQNKLGELIVLEWINTSKLREKKLRNSYQLVNWQLAF